MEILEYNLTRSQKILVNNRIITYHMISDNFYESTVRQPYILSRVLIHDPVQRFEAESVIDFGHRYGEAIS